jgi:hypothetical protein
MWEPRRLTIIWASTSTYKDGFTFYKTRIYRLLVFLIFSFIFHLSLSYLSSISSLLPPLFLHPSNFLLLFHIRLHILLAFSPYVKNPLQNYSNLFIRNNYVKKVEDFKMCEIKTNTKNWKSQDYICCKWVKHLTRILPPSEAIKLAKTFRTSWLSVVKICRWVSMSEYEQ